MIEVNFKQLREAVVSLNKSGLIPKSIPLVGIEKDKIYEKFMNAMDKIEDDPETGEFPAGAKEALTFFNKMVDLEKKEKEGEVKSEIKEDDNDKKIVKKEKKNSNKIENKDIKKEEKKKPSRKLLIYQEWKKSGEKISHEDLLKIGEGLSFLTIKTWISAWKRNQNLPSLQEK